jgi:3',5'-cyclic AMP phosphodiesterase CpdA
MASSTFDTVLNQNLPAMPGGGEQALRYAAADAAGGYRVQTALAGAVTSYTLVYDLLVSAEGANAYAGLLQTDLANASDGELFLRANGESGGIGTGGVYEGAVSYDAWHRLSFTFEAMGGNVTKLSKYVDGALVGTQDVATDRYTLGADGFLILADEDGETRAGALGGFLFDSTVMTAAQIAALGKASAGGILPQAPNATATQFDFKDGMNAGFGPGSLAARDPAAAGTLGDLAELGLPPRPDAAEAVLVYPAATSAQGYLVKPGIDAAITTYTLIYDLQIRPETMASYQGLFQTDLAQDSDAELFLHWTGETTYGTGISGQYEGQAAGGDWHRLGFTLADQGSGSTLLSKYIDGVLVGTQSVPTDRFTIDGTNGFLILTDEDGETAQGFLSSFAFTDLALSQAEMAALGGVRRGGILDGATAPGHATQFDFHAGTYAASFGDGVMNRRAQDGTTFGDAAEVGAAPLPGSQNEALLGFPASEPGQGYAVNPGITTGIASYTLVFDILIPKGQEGDYGALLQTVRADGGDADLFLRVQDDGSIGLGISGQYDGAMGFDAWHRIAVTITAGEDGSALLQKYIDGIKVGEQSVDAARYTLNGEAGFMLLADDDGETWAGWLNSLHFTDRAMSEAEIGALGGATAGGIIPDAPAEAGATQFDFEQGTLAATYGPGSLQEVGLMDGPILLAGIADQRVAPEQDSLTIDLAGVFNGDGLTFSVTTSDGAAVEGAAVVDGKLVLALGGVGFNDVTITATDSAGQSVSDDFRVRMMGDKAYTIAILPDTQDYTSAGEGQQIFNGMTQWLADNAARLDLRFVTSVGDVTGSNQPPQWDIAKEAFSKLNGITPYAMLPGNHDQGSGGSANSYESLQSDYFSVDWMQQHSTLGGVYDQEPDKTSNAWYSFEGGDGTKWLALSLEFGPRDDVLRWADEVLTAHSDHRVIVSTHHYTNMGTRADNYSGPLYAEGTGKDYGIGGSAENANDGEDIWQGLISKHANVSFVFSGHVFGDGAETIVGYNEAGQPVYQMFVNYQNGVSLEVTGNGDASQGGHGGQGAIRLLTIDPENDAFYTETYLSAKGKYLTGYRDSPEPSRDGSGETVDAPDTTVQPVTFGSISELALPALPDGDSGAFTAPKFDPNNGLKVTPGFAPKDGGTTYDAYTLIYDLYMPQQGGLGVFFQSDLNNITDGDLWMNFREGFALVGTNGQDEGNLPLGSWHRVGFTLERVGEGGSTFTLNKYVDGVLQGSQTVGAVFNVTEKGFLIFADDSSETPVFSLSSFAFVEKALSAEEMAALGGPTAAGPFDGPIDGVNAVQFDFTDGDFTRTFGSGSMTQSIGEAQTRQLSGSFLDHQQTVTGVVLGTPTVQFHARAGDDQVVEGGLVSLDGSGTVDPLGQVLRYEWLDADGVVIATKAQAQVALAGGQHQLTLRVTDAGGTVSTDQVKVAVADAATLLQEDFNDGNADGWQLPAGNWQLAGSVASRDVAVPGIAAADGHMRAYDGGAGIMTWQGGAAWSGYTLSASLTTEDQKGFGLVAYYQDAQNFYRLEFDISANTRSLVKLQDGVETVLATEAATSPFDRAMAVEFAVSGGQLYATVDGEALFGGAVADAAPLAGGTVGLWSEGQRQVNFDDVMVRQGTPIADAGKTIRVIDTDGDGMATVHLSGATSFGSAEGVTWSSGGRVVASGLEADVALETGQHLLTLDLGGSKDTVKVEVIAAADLLVQEDFADGAAQGWRFVDEGELGGAADWSVADGGLVQSSNRYSRQLGGSADTAPTAEWSLNWSPLGDGIYALRKGAYAVYEGEGAGSWADYAMEASFTAPAGGGVGFLLHYVDANNYYKLELDNQTGLAQLFSLKDGIEQTLWQGPQRYDQNGSQLRTEIQDGRLHAWIDGVALFTVPIEIHDTEQGTVALYNWGNAGVSFDDVLVTRLGEGGPAPLNPVTGTAGDDLLAGTAGDDHFVGGNGFDVVAYGGVRGDYAVSATGELLRVTGPEGNDIAEGIEAIRFLDGGIEFSAAGTGHLVERLYQGALGRDADDLGLAFWTGEMEQGIGSAAVARAMLASTEADATKLDDADFVAGLYDGLLGRAGTAGELGFWTELLAQGQARGDVLAGIAASQEAAFHQGDAPLVVADLEAVQVGQAYHALLGRDADRGGLTFWQAALEKGMAVPEMLEQLAATAEAMAQLAQGDNAAFLNRLYDQAFGRAGDAAGLTYWGSMLEGGADRGAVAIAFAGAEENLASLQRLSEEGLTVI